MKERAIQYFSDEYIARSKELTPDEVLQFLDDWQKLHTEQPEKSQLISLKIKPSLLSAFKTRCELMGVPYQAQIKKLMKEWMG